MNKYKLIFLVFFSFLLDYAYFAEILRTFLLNVHSHAYVKGNGSFIQTQSQKNMQIATDDIYAEWILLY